MSNIDQKEKELLREIEKKLPEFVLAVKNETNDVVQLHQDSFAAGYDDEEYPLLGKAIKYAGIYGKSILIHGTNRTTLNKS
jgi:hypothetical protein